MVSILETIFIDALESGQNMREEWVNRKADYEKLTAEFRRDFPVEKIREFTILDYVAGNQNKKSFCYRIERGLRAAGSISGSPVNRYGVYFSAKEGKLKATKYLNEDVDSGLETMKGEIIKLVKIAGDLAFEDYDQSLVSNMFKNKILHVYHPEDFLSIYSPEHLYWLCEQLNLQYRKVHPYYTHQALLEFKRSHDVFSKLSNWEFSHLVYQNCVPESDFDTFGDWSKKNKKEDNGLENEDEPAQSITWAEGDKIGVPRTQGGTGKGGKGKYPQTQLQNMKTGLKGEEIVVSALKEKWASDPGLEVDHVAKRDDSKGYDIIATIFGEKHYIEVKSTRSKMASAQVFITQNELDQAKKHKDQYYIYFVEGVFDESVRINVIKNPFLNPQPAYKIKLQEVKYQMSFIKESR